MNFNFDLDINTEGLQEDIEKLDKEIERLKNALEELKAKNVELEDYWSTRTSEEVFSQFHDAYEYIENIIKDLENDRKFLKENVISSHETYEDSATKTIETELRA